MEFAKKMYLLPSTDFERMKPKQESYVAATSLLDSELRQILQRDDLREEEKARLYQQVLQRYLTLRQKRDEEPIRLKVDNEKSESKPIANILKPLPKKYRADAVEVLNNLSWDDRGQLRHNGVSVEGSDISTLVQGFVSSAAQARETAEKTPGWKELLEIAGSPEFQATPARITRGSKLNKHPKEGILWDSFS